MNPATRVQTLDEAACILHGANTFVKSGHPTILLLAVDKL